MIYRNKKGAEPKRQELYSALMAECLARGSELVTGAIDRIAAGSDFHISAAVRQQVLLKTLLLGLGASGLDTPTKATEYLTYHRDGLLRRFLATGARAQALQEFDRRLGRMTVAIRRLHRIALLAARVKDPAADSWPEALGRLKSHLRDVRERLTHLRDPLAPESIHPSLFEIFHEMSKQIGLRPLEEAFVYHLLKHAINGEVPGECHLREPDFRVMV